MKNDIIKVGDSLYLKMDSMEQLSAIVKFLDDAKLKKAANELLESMKKDEEPKDVADKFEKPFDDVLRAYVGSRHDENCWIYGRKETLSKLVKDCFEANLAFENKKKIEELEKQLNELCDADKSRGDIQNVDKLVKQLTDELDDTDRMVFDHEDRLNRLEEDIAKLEKAVADIPKTMGKITAKMMEANMGKDDKDLKSFSINMYWNYDDSEDEEDDD